LFGGVDAACCGTLGQAVSTLFQILTLEGWVEVVINNLEGARREEHVSDADASSAGVADELREVRSLLDRIERRIGRG
jgi:hypothetical protein